jgi:hypothetical protein
MTKRNTPKTADSNNLSRVLVKGIDPTGAAWKEQTELISVSRNGAGFCLDRLCPAGTLLSLIIRLPQRLRGYDHDLELYRVCGLVQNSHYLPEKQRFQTGVALVGKHLPESYRNNPEQTFRIIGIGEDGLWKITETERPFVSRRFPRFSVSLDVSLAPVDEDGTPSLAIASVTENVSTRGAAVLTELNANVGDCVRFSSREPKFSVLAVVRNRKPHHETVSRLHLEFVTADFPVKEIAVTDVADGPGGFDE